MDTVVDSVAGLNIVIADSGRVIFHEIKYLGYNIGRNSVDEIIIIDSGLSLQDIAVVEKDDTAGISGAK